MQFAMCSMSRRKRGQKPERSGAAKSSQTLSPAKIPTIPVSDDAERKENEMQNEADSAVSKASFDAILDCGASDIYFPAIHEDKTTDILYQSGSIYL